jgi:predicted PurR-regulated permease PerM
MIEAAPEPASARKALGTSYWFILGVFVAVKWLHLATPLLVALFGYLALHLLQFGNRIRKSLAVVLFLLLLACIGYSLGYLVNQVVPALPAIAEQAIPSVIDFAQQHHVELPFTDYDSLKDLAVASVKDQAQYLASVARIARGATTQFVLVLVGCVVAISVFLNPRLDMDRNRLADHANLYSIICDRIADRFSALYESFRVVIGAQLLISAINTVLTTVFVLAVGLPYSVVIIGTTFLCGLVPVIGNLVSNTVIVGIGFTISPKMALGALAFLVGIHKLEYFLNSKIIGARIRNPLWLTLLGLVIGERILGLPGLILAPVVLHYVRTETSRIRVGDAPECREK